jgi:hypothetical protein
MPHLFPTSLYAKREFDGKGYTETVSSRLIQSAVVKKHYNQIEHNAFAIEQDVLSDTVGA